MLNGDSCKSAAIFGSAVLSIEVSRACIKYATAAIHGKALCIVGVIAVAI
jgi:hypothetical protein